MNRAGSLGVWTGAALYVGSLLGPGVLLVPSLARQAAGPASVISWGGLLLLSLPLAVMFAALGTRMPVSGGVAEYVRAGFGERAGLAAGGWFLTAVLFGAPTVATVGGLYVADLTGAGAAVAALVALAIFGAVLGTNAAGLRVSARVQLIVAGVLTLMIATAVLSALPSSRSGRWTPFAPHGWWAVGTAANILIWLFVGWESVAQLVGEFRSPPRQLPRAMALAYGTVSVLYVGLAVVTVSVTLPSASAVPLADLLTVGLGQTGRWAAVVLAVALTMATMSVYIASAARLASALATSGALPRWLAGDHHLTVPRRPLVVIGVIGVALLIALAAGVIGIAVLVRAASSCFLAVYVSAVASGVRILRGRIRWAAIPTLGLLALITLFSSWYLLVPAVSGVCFLGLGRPGAATRRNRGTFSASGEGAPASSADV